MTDSGEETVWAIKEPIHKFMKKYCLTKDVIAACQNYKDQCPARIFIVETNSFT